MVRKQALNKCKKPITFKIWDRRECISTHYFYTNKASQKNAKLWKLWNPAKQSKTPDSHLRAHYTKRRSRPLCAHNQQERRPRAQIHMGDGHYQKPSYTVSIWQGSLMYQHCFRWQSLYCHLLDRIGNSKTKKHSDGIMASIFSLLLYKHNTDYCIASEWLSNLRLKNKIA